MTTAPACFPELLSIGEVAKRLELSTKDNQALDQARRAPCPLPWTPALCLEDRSSRRREQTSETMPKGGHQCLLKTMTNYYCR
jgi:hypothetical protein